MYLKGMQVSVDDSNITLTLETCSCGDHFIVNMEQTHVRDDLNQAQAVFDFMFTIMKSMNTTSGLALQVTELTIDELAALDQLQEKQDRAQYE